VALAVAGFFSLFALIAVACWALLNRILDNDEHAVASFRGFLLAVVVFLAGVAFLLAK
jgi:hypothetical protein